MQRANIRIAAEGWRGSPRSTSCRVARQRAAGRPAGAEAAAYTEVEAYPLDILGAETQGMIGYLLEQELGNLLPFEVPLATILTMVEVDPDDPAFDDPTKFVGPVYDEATAKALAAEKGWTVKPDGEYWRRVVPSPRPLRIFEMRPMKWLLEQGVLVICAGGGGIPTMYARGEDRQPRRRRGGRRQGPRRRACWRASWRPTCIVMATDVDGVYMRLGTPDQRRLDQVTPTELERQLPGRVDGSQGRGRDRVREGERATRRHRLIGRHRRDRGRDRRHEHRSGRWLSRPQF